VLKYNFPLSKKLFTLICIVLLLIILPLFYIYKTSLTQFGRYAHTVNEKQIKSMSNFYLSRIVTEQAKSYDEIFKKIKAVSFFQSVQSIFPMIINTNQGIINLMINNEKYILATGSLESVDWQLVLVAGKSDIQIAVNKTGIALDKSLGDIWKN